MMTPKARGWGIVIAAAALGLAGCGGSGGGAGTASHPIGDAAIQGVDVVARAGTFQRPLDAAPSPDGMVIYFVATAGGGPVVLSAPAAGGAPSTVVRGAPLAKPTGVAVATDGTHLFIADQQAVPPAAIAGSGAILTAPATGNEQIPTVLPGTEGRAPRGLDVVNQGGHDVIYFTGVDPANAKPGLFLIAATGGTVTTIAEGAPFTAPDSVVVGGQGVAYVTDQGSGPGQGEVFKVTGGTANAVLNRLHLGAPAGVTLVNGDATLLVSSLNATSLADQVLFLDLATGKTAAASKVVGANTNSSGGLHRAYTARGVAWADVRGTVYRVRFP